MLRHTSILASILLIGGLFYVGAQPVVAGLFASPIDKIAHAGVFGLIAMLLWFAFDRRYPLLVISVVAIIGAMDEVHQFFLSGRFADISDWIADVGGGCLPLFVSIFSSKRCGKNADALSNNGLKTNVSKLPDQPPVSDKTIRS